MPRIFIGWGGNKPLADEVAKQFKGSGYTAIVGGDKPTDMYVGTQVIDQIKKCDKAILLVENYNGQISPNLLFEWGFIVAYKKIPKIHIFMINKSQRELPSDLLGVWVKELVRDANDNESDKHLAEIICNDFISDDKQNKLSHERFNLIPEWTSNRCNFAENINNLSSDYARENIIMSCLAAYYFGDNRYLRNQLELISGDDELNNTVTFAKSYVDVFLQSGNMIHEIPPKAFFGCQDVFETRLNDLKDSNDDLDVLELILCYDIYGLACTLYLKNRNLSDTIRRTCINKTLECYKNAFAYLELLDDRIDVDDCLFNLLRAYLNNDMANFYQTNNLDDDKFLEYLDKSVAARKTLHLAFSAKYSNNAYLKNKFEQEYMIALSKQCLYMTDPFKKALTIEAIKERNNDWKSELDYTYSLIT